ncbi:MAG: Synechococcus phage S-ShM2 [Candidatus Parcubacteria bacterium]|jgi:DNA repair exonuclease SbcCD ATPase subunit
MILFTKIRWKNFLSTGNAFTEIDLTRSPNTLIIGQNGAGKSTILDALTFGLFGKPFRKINKPQLLNSINNSNAVVEIEFSIGKKKYKVVRGMKPNIFEIYCDDVLVNQDAKAKDYQEHLEKFIIKLNYKSFTQVVVLGSASFVPFMQLSAADRRTIIEELLDIGIFSSMNVLLKNKLSTLKDEQKDNDYNQKLIVEKINLQKQNIEENKKNHLVEINKKEKEVADNNAYLTKISKNIVLIQKHIEQLSNKINDELAVKKKSTKIQTLQSKFDDSIKKLNKEISFYETNDNCPTCHQNITVDTKDKNIKEKQTKITEITDATEKLKTELDIVENRLSEITKIQKHISEHNSEIVKLNTQVTSINNYNAKVLKEIDELKSRSNTNEVDDEKLKTLNSDLEKAKSVAEQLSIDKQYYEFASTLLKDTGIKTKIIKQYLPVMNKLINKYLTAMDFFVNFNLNESFEETIKSRHRDEFSYASFSEGEKMRIDLALLFTWRQVAKMKNSVNTNLLILDEVFDSSLDGVGTEEFLKLLNSLDTKTNVFVISHKGDQLFDKFRSIIKFEKKNNFSQVVK